MATHATFFIPAVAAERRGWLPAFAMQVHLAGKTSDLLVRTLYEFALAEGLLFDCP